MTDTISIPITVRALLTNIIDYAGLFPPANLSMPQAVANYAAYRNGEHSWMLGRFIAPMARLDEFEEAARPFLPETGAKPMWRLSLLGSGKVSDDASRISRFNKEHRDMAIDTLELKASEPTEIQRTMPLIPKGVGVFFEIPIKSDLTTLLGLIARVGARAKIRTGGITPDMFPASRELAGFISACARANAAFKATAGLHHPVRSCYHLTYNDDSPTGMMYGFLNVFLAAAFIRKGMNELTAIKLLEEESPEAFHFSENEVEWRGHKISNDEIIMMRKMLGISFGSCSFSEPVNDLHTLHVL